MQFWNLLSASVGNFDFDKLLKRQTTYEDRIRHRIEILGKMQDEGIWLLDVSLFALYPKERNNQAILYCWENWTKSVIVRESPEKILVVGKEVWEILGDKIPLDEDKKDWIYQPQARLLGGYGRELEKCYRFCHDGIRTHSQFSREAQSN